MSTNIRTVTVQQMVQHFADLTYKKRTNGQITKVDPNSDALSVWFSKADIDQFFSDNGFTGGAGQQAIYGLRIYHGLHGNSTAEQQDMPSLAANYLGQHTGILVVTIKDANGVNQDQLNAIGNAVALTGGGGSGLDEGQICPPPPPGQSCPTHGAIIVVT